MVLIRRSKRVERRTRGLEVVGLGSRLKAGAVISGDDRGEG